MGMIGLVFSIAPAIGPSIAGFIIDIYNWNVVFLGLVPLIVLDIVICAFVMPNTGETEVIPLDKLSVIMSTIGFGGMLYGLSSVSTYGWTSLHVYVPLILGIIIVYLFVKRQSKLDVPLLRFSAFQSKNFTVGLIIGMAIYAALLFGGVLTPIYLQDIHGYSVFIAAIIMLPAALISAAINPLVGSLFDKLGGRPIILLGLFLLAAGSASYLLFTEESSTWFLVVMYSIRILGINVVMMPVNTWSMADFTGEIITHANAVFNTLRQIAGSVGTAIFVSVYTIVAQSSTSLAGIHAAFGASAVLMLATFILAWVKIPKREKKSWEK